MISRVASDRPSSELDQQLAELLAEAADKLRAGEPVDLSDYVRRYPDFAERLEQLLPAMRTLAELGHSHSSVPSSVAGRGEAFEEVRGVLGDFRILREIGRGGMGVVYEAEQVSLGRRMALKVLPFAGVLDERQLTRFRNEARAAASLKHPNIVGVHSVGCERGVHYYAMEFIEGRTLAEVIAELRQESGRGDRTLLPERPEGCSAQKGPVPWPQAGRGSPDPAPAADASVGGSLRAPPDPVSERPDHEAGRGSPDPAPAADASVGGSLRAPPAGADTDRQVQAKVSTHKPTTTKEFFRRVAEWGIQAAEGLEHAHQMGIVHRDIKPSNLLVDASGHLWITDFGLAQILAPSPVAGEGWGEGGCLTMTGDILGTLRYMSPEQAAGRSRVLDHRTDVYSLGVTLYEVLTLRPPFSGDDRQAVLRQIGDDEPPALRQLNRSIPRDLETIVLKAMSKEPPARYATAQALADDLERFLADQPIQARRPSLVERARKSSRRHRTIMWAIVASAFAVMAVLAVSVLLLFGAYAEERAARRDADQQKLAANRNAENAEKQATEATRQRGEAVRQKTEAERQRDAARENLYLADTRLVFVDIGLGNTRRAHESLLAHIPDRGEADRRGWEWYYLLQRSHEAEQALYGHESAVLHIAWSPDGNYIASTSEDGSARVWDAKTGKQLRCFGQGPTMKHGLGWSPDSRQLAWGSCGDEAALRVWNRETDKIVVAHHDGHKGSIWCVAWSHDGKSLATGSIFDGASQEPGNIRIWDVEKLAPIAQFTLVRNSLSLSWSPDDKLLAAVDSKGDGRVLWDVASQQQLPDPVMQQPMCAAWHPTGPLLAVGSGSGNCQIWDRRSQKAIRQWKGHQGDVSDIQWSGDGTLLLSSGRDGRVKLWDAQEGREQKSVAAHAGFAASVAWNPSGRQFASCGTDGVIRVWPVESRRIPLVIDTKLNGTLDLAWDKDSSTQLLASSDAGKIGVWEACSGKMLEVIPLRQDSNRRLVSFRYVLERSAASGDVAAVVRVSAVPANAALAKTVSSAAFNDGYFDFLNDAVLSPDRTRIAYMSFAATNQSFRRPLIRDVDSDRVVQCPEVVHPRGVAWSPNSRLLAVVGCGAPSDEGTPQYAGWVHVFDRDSGERLHKLQIGTSRVYGTAVAWSHHGRKFAAGNEEGLCEIWDAASGRKLMSAQIHSSRVHDLAWSLDDRRIASGGINEQVHLWDGSTGQQLLALESHGAPIRHIRWSPDGRKLAAVSEDGVIRVWDATTGYELPNRDFWRHLIRPRQWKEFARLTDEQRWSEAAELLQQMIAAGGPDWWPLYQLALVNLQLDDQAAYRETCRRMLATFADTEGEREARSTAWACALCPGTLDDYGLAITLARRALDGQIDSRTNTVGGRATYRETLGAVLFRAGQYEEALRHVQAASEMKAESKLSPARIAFLLAMTHQRLGHAADARMWLDRANKEAREELTSAKDPPAWTPRLELGLLQREAQELVAAQDK